MDWFNTYERVEKKDKTHIIKIKDLQTDYEKSNPPIEPYYFEVLVCRLWLDSSFKRQKQIKGKVYYNSLHGWKKKSICSNTENIAETGSGDYQLTTDKKHVL